MSKPLNPYSRLKAAAQRLAAEVRKSKRGTRGMFTLKNAKSGAFSYDMRDVYQRAAAAEQLGFDVRLVVDGDHLHIVYAPRVSDDVLWGVE